MKSTAGFLRATIKCLQRSLETGTSYTTHPTRPSSYLCSVQALASWSNRSCSDSAGGRTQDRTFKKLEEAQKLELRLNGHGRYRPAPGRPQAQACSESALSHQGEGTKFRKPFELACRALPELPTLRELVLWLGYHGSRFGQGPGGPFGALEGWKESSPSAGRR